MVTVEVFEGNDTLLVFRFRRKKVGGGTEAYPLVGDPTVEMYIKGDLDLADNAPEVIKYSTATGDITITQDGSTTTYSEITVQLKASDMSPARTDYFHIDVVRGSKRETLKNGLFQITNI